MRWTPLKAPLFLLITALALAGCDNATTAPLPGGSSLSSSDLASMAVTDEILSGAMLNDAMAAAGTSMPAGDRVASVSSTLTGTFSRTRDCPAGGTVTLTGSLSRTRDNDTTTWVVNGTRQRSACTLARDSGTVALTGSSSYQAHREKVSGVWYGDQTSSAVGNFHWVRTLTSTGATSEGDCSFNLQAVRDPTTHTLKVTGTACGKTVDRTVSWSG